jgi:hypothetical protein
MKIAKNRICYATHNVVCDPDCADADYMVAMADSLNPTGTSAEHLKELHYMNNDGTWTIERPTIKLQIFWQSEAAERLQRIPTHILATALLHNGEYEKVLHVVSCARSESFQPLWKSLYQADIKVGAAQRRRCEKEYFAVYDKAVAEHEARNYEDPACAI